MKTWIAAAMAFGLSFGIAQAQSMNKSDGDKKAATPGATGAMQNSNANGVATDPNGVAAQQGDSSKASPGTVGAAPGGDTNSQKPSGQK